MTVSRLTKPEQEISDSMDPDAVRRLFTGQLDQGEYVDTDTQSYESVWGAQHAEGIHGVRLANAIHLSSWLGRRSRLPTSTRTVTSPS